MANWVYSVSNGQATQEQKVKKVPLPARGRLSMGRAKRQKQRWFKRALQWRARIEAQLAT